MPINPGLGSLGFHGGNTQTQAIMRSSPAYRQGDCGGNATVSPAIPAVSTDQRGANRKITGVGCDVGAYESNVQGSVDSIGVYRAGTFYLRLHNSQGFADLTVSFNPSGKNLPIMGDWTGSGFDSVGVFDQNTGRFTLCNANVTAICANPVT